MGLKLLSIACPDSFSDPSLKRYNNGKFKTITFCSNAPAGSETINQARLLAA
jgi:hypothetical protein